MLRSRPYLLVLLLFVLSLMVMSVVLRRPIEDLRNFVFDSLQRTSPLVPEPDGPVRIVDIDEASLTSLGQWPWPRHMMADLVSRLQKAGAAAIVFDIVFSEADRTSPENMLRVIPDEALRERLRADIGSYVSHDQQFAKQIADSNVVLALALTEDGTKAMPEAKAGFATAGDSAEQFVPTFSSGIAPLLILLEAAKGIGATNWLPDRDQVIRSVPLLLKTKNGLMPSLFLESLRVAQGAGTFVVRTSNASGQTAFGANTGINAVKTGNLEIPTGSRGEVRVRFSYTQKGRYHSAASVLAGTFDPSTIQGRIVLVGTSAIGLSDLRATPLEAALPGVEVHAQIIEHILSGKSFYRPDWMIGVEWLLALFLGVGLWIVLPMTSVFASALIGAIIASIMVAASFWLFVKIGLHMDPAFPAIAGLVAYLLSSATLWQVERSTRSQLRQAFGKFLAPAVIDQLVENPQRLVLGGETRDMTILFSDLRNFTGISEGLDAQQLTAFMNAYLTPMTDIILDRSGTVDKYIGDAIVAFWNAPLDDAKHPLNAVLAALDMRSALANINNRRVKKELGAPDAGMLQFGVGINTGPCSVGNMGSTRRFDYSALGDTVNLASRIEGLSKLFGVDILGSQAVVELTRDFAWLKVGDVRVKGKKQATTLYLLCGNEAYAKSEIFLAWQQKHDRMFADFYDGNFAAAMMLCQKLEETAPALKLGLYSSISLRLSKASRGGHKEHFDPVLVF
jgi:adenylate cyclase